MSGLPQYSKFPILLVTNYFCLFLSILIKTTRFYFKRLQNDGALNFVQFFSGPLCTTNTARFA